MANHYTREIPTVSNDQRQQLQRWLRRQKTSQALASRARIILNSAEGHSDQAVAQMLSTTRATVGKWRRRFLRNGCDGLLDEPRSGTPRSIGDDEVEQVVVRTLESMPRGGTQWSTRSMARACPEFGEAAGGPLKPHRSETFKLSRDPLFIEKVRDIDLHPPERA